MHLSLDHLIGFIAKASEKLVLIKGMYVVPGSAVTTAQGSSTAFLGGEKHQVSVLDKTLHA